MPSADELQVAIQENAKEIAEVRARVDGHDEDIDRHERHIAKLDEAVTVLRESMARVATKDDIMALRTDILKTNAEQMRDAHNSIPVKLAAWFGGGMLLLGVLDFVLGHLHG